MIGIVIWSCVQSQRVILWCEDNGPLAFVRGAEAFAATPAVFPEVGDVVAFLVDAAEGIAPGAPASRQARAVRLIERGRYPQIDKLLKAAAGAPAQGPGLGLDTGIVPLPRQMATG